MVTDVVLIGFVASDHSDAPRNPKLADFVRESALEVGEQRSVELCVGEALPLVDKTGHERILAGEYRVSVGVKGGIGGTGAGAMIGKVLVADA